MFFVSRHILGKTLAPYVAHLRGQEPIVLCLKESSLGVANSVAAEVRGWVYPLLTEHVVVPGDGRTIGVVNQDGNLCHNPELSRFELADLEMNNQGVIQDEMRNAFSRLNKRTSDYGQLNKEGLRGRTVIIIGDIVRDQLEIAAARDFLKTIRIQGIVSLVGNITPDSRTALYMESQDSTFLDVMPHMFDDGHYFEQSDEYTIEQQRLIAMNIAQYWT